jgi:hypothetical protein
MQTPPRRRRKRKGQTCPMASGLTPPAVPRAILISHRPPEGDPDKYRGMLDSSGNSYDPERHLYPPEKTRTGRWRKLPRAQLAQKAAEGGEAPGETAANIRGEAQKLATLYATAHLIPFGSGGAIKSPELVPLIDAYERFMLVHGVIETPPGLDAALTSFTYSATVAQRPGNIERVKNWGGRLWQWIQEKRTGRKRKPKKPADTGKSTDEPQSAEPQQPESEPSKKPETGKADKGPRWATTKDGDVIVPDVLGELDRAPQGGQN